MATLLEKKKTLKLPVKWSKRQLKLFMCSRIWLEVIRKMKVEENCWAQLVTLDDINSNTEIPSRPSQPNLTRYFKWIFTVTSGGARYLPTAGSWCRSSRSAPPAPSPWSPCVRSRGWCHLSNNAGYKTTPGDQERMEMLSVFNFLMHFPAQCLWNSNENKCFPCRQSRTVPSH